MADTETGTTFVDKLKAYIRTRKGTILTVEIVSDFFKLFFRHHLPFHTTKLSEVNNLCVELAS